MNLGGPIVKDRLYFYGSYYRPEKTRDNRRNLYGDLPQYDSTRNEGFGKLTFTPTKSRPAQLQLPRLEARRTRATSSSRTPPRRPARGNEARLKIGTADGSWVINSRSFADLQVHPLHEPHAGAARQRGRRRHLHGRRHAARHHQPRHPGPAHGARCRSAARPPTTRSSSPSSTATATSRTACGSGGGTVGYGTLFDNDDFFRDAGQIGYNLTLGSDRHPRPPRRLPALQGLGGPDPRARTAGA